MDGMPFGLAGTRRVPASEAFLPPPHPHMRQTITIGPLAKSSMAVFRSHLRTKEDGLIDASAIHSKACFNEWVATREGLQKHPEKTFQRTLTATLSGSDGRIPFTPQEEAAILEVLRAKRVWCDLLVRARFSLTCPQAVLCRPAVGDHWRQGLPLLRLPRAHQACPARRRAAGGDAQTTTRRHPSAARSARCRA